jgi:hypothetical protein
MMNAPHPFIGDLSEKTLEEIQETITKLNKNLIIMGRMGKHEMVSQIHLVLGNYRSEYNKRQQEIYEKSIQKYEDRINIQKD